MNIKQKVKVGDFLYSLSYYTHPFRKIERSFSKRKIKKISYNAVRFTDNSSFSLSAINDTLVDEWYTSKELLFKGKLKAYLREHKEVLREIEYLRNKVNALSKPVVNKEEKK